MNASLRLAAWALLCLTTMPPAGAASPSGADAIAAPVDLASPVGVWKTFDDKTGAARGLVRIYSQDGKLFGRVEQSFTPGAEARICAACSDERKNQPIIGLIIIRNMKPDGSEFSGGDILDPDSGSLYHCKLHLEDNGTRLVVRGYIGFSLLGRSQTWVRSTGQAPRQP